jgi:hypothetical protein
MFKKDNLKFGLVLGLLAPFIGFTIFKINKLGPLSIADALTYLRVEPGHRTLTAAISLSLLANAVLFTLYVNNKKDKTARGIFIVTCLWAITALVVKFV